MNYLNREDLEMVERMSSYVERARLKGAIRRKATKMGTVKALVLDRNGMVYRWVLLQVIMGEVIAPIGTSIAALTQMDGEKIEL